MPVFTTCGLGMKSASVTATSMATPMVSGAAALLLQQNPSLTPDQVKARLMKTAYKAFPPSSTATDPTTGITYTSQYDLFTVGSGYLDIQAALLSTDLASATTGSAMTPAVTQDANGNIVLVAPRLYGGIPLFGVTPSFGATRSFRVST